MTLLAPPPNAQYLISNKLNNRYYNEANQTVLRRYIPIQRSHSFIDTFSKRHANRGALFIAEAFWQQDVSRPTSVEMEPIMDCDQLDQILQQAQELSQPIVVDWMAAWCRKCIFLKPKLEKLAAEFDTKVKFYYVDVNKVPQALVKRGNVTKMPTIQVWKDGEMKEEVIGGHQAWLVIEEVREMIRKYV